MAKKPELSLAEFNQSLKAANLSVSPTIKAQLEAHQATVAAESIVPATKPKSSKGDSNLSILNSNIVKLTKAIQDNTKVLDAKSRVTKGNSPTSANDLSEKDIETQRVTDYQTGLLEKIEKNTRITVSSKEGSQEKESESSFVKLGLLGTTLAISLGAIVGTLIGQAKVMMGTLKLLAKMLPQNIIQSIVNTVRRIPQVISDMVTKVMVNIEYAFRIITDLFKNKFPNAFAKIEKTVIAFRDIAVNTFDKAKKIVISIAEVVTNVFKTLKEGFIKYFAEPISRGFKLIKEGSASVSNSVGKVGKFITGIGKFFGDIGKWFGSFAKVFKGTMLIAEKLAMPITVIMGLFDGITEAIKGYEKGGIMGGIQGFITGVFNSVVSSFLDLIKDMVSWVLDKLGFDEASKMLDSFSFTDIYTKFIDKLFHPFDTLKEIFTNLGDMISKLEIPKFTIPLVGDFGPWKPFAGITELSKTAAKTGGDITAPMPTSANQVYNQSAQNKEADKKGVQPKSSTVITAPTQVNNQTQNAYVKTPIRNNDNTINRYLAMNF